MMTRSERRRQVDEMVKAARETGWQPIGNDIVRRSVEHNTPSHAKKAGWWNGSTYPSVEYLSFVYRPLWLAPVVVYGYGSSPWQGRKDERVTFGRAVELLAQPVRFSEVHNS